MSSRTIQLRDVAEIDVGFPFRSGDFERDSDGVRLLRGDNIGQGRLRWEEAARWPADRLVDPRFALRAGDVVVAMDRPWVSAGLKAARLQPSDLPSYLVQRVARLRAREGYPQGYVAALTSSQAFTDHLMSVQTGTAVPHISAKQIGSFRLDVLNSSVQSVVAGVLESLDDKRAANTSLGTVALALAQAHFRAAVVDADVEPFSKVLTAILGGTPDRSRSDYWSGSALWASARDVTGAPFGVILDTAEKIDDVAAQSTRVKPLPAGSVVLTARGTVGAVARLGVAASFNQSCYGFAPTALPPAVLYFSVLHATEQAKAYAHGSVFSTITTRTFDHLQIPSFEPSEVERLEAVLGPLLDMVTSAAQENVALAALRDTLLPELMSGRLRVKDAEQQVGEVL